MHIVNVRNNCDVEVEVVIEQKKMKNKHTHRSDLVC